MNQFQLRGLLKVDSDRIVDLLTTRQHAHPQETLSQATQHVTHELGCCPDAIARATQWLQIDPKRAIGRLRRSELLQLAKVIHRFWQNAGAETENAEHLNI